MASWDLGTLRTDVPFWRGYKTAQQTITTNTNTAITTFVVRESGGGTWAYPSGASPNTYWQVPVAGLYQICYELSMNTTTAAANEIFQGTLTIDVESAPGVGDEHYARVQKLLLDTTDVNPMIQGSILLRLTTSNKLYLLGYSNSGGTIKMPASTAIADRIDVTLHYVAA